MEERVSNSGRKTQKVYLWMRTYIDENKFANSGKLPSENVLSIRLSVSRETVRLAFKRLEEEGLIRRVKGSGTFINKEVALTKELGGSGGKIKVGLILQGQDTAANSSLIEGIRGVVSEDEVDLRIFLTDNKFVNERRCLQTIIHQDFQGFIVDGVKASMLNQNLDCYEQIYQKKIPVIFYNNYYKNLKYPHVTVNDRQCANRLMALLIKAGHRRNAGIFNYDNYQSIEKFQGMTAAMRRYDVEFQDDYIKWYISDESHESHFERSVEKFLKNLPQCTAIVCCNVMIYRLVQQIVEGMGKSIPEDYSVVCFDYSGDDWREKGITCSIHQGNQIGQEVATRLLKMIKNREWKEEKYSCVLSPQIFVGNSIGQARHKVFCQS